MGRLIGPGVRGLVRRLDVGRLIIPDVGGPIGPDVGELVGPNAGGLIGPDVRELVGPDIGEFFGPDVDGPVRPDFGELVVDERILFTKLVGRPVGDDWGQDWPVGAVDRQPTSIALAIEPEVVNRVSSSQCGA
jgi:hypothetical protein